jgi:hypothetical protein
VRTETKQDNERHKEDDQALKLDPVVDGSFNTNLLGFSPITLTRQEESRKTQTVERVGDETPIFIKCSII